MGNKTMKDKTTIKDTDLTKEELRRLAGWCINCTNYDFEEARFTETCYTCRRYYGDNFEAKHEKV